MEKWLKKMNKNIKTSKLVQTNNKIKQKIKQMLKKSHNKTIKIWINKQIKKTKDYSKSQKYINDWKNQRKLFALWSNIKKPQKLKCHAK